ncbi:MAG: hypothetical protein M3Y71_16045 [Actinomycetota bacterium]|nr:hypothetical protein [Actinomycetota bacterium]
MDTWWSVTPALLVLVGLVLVPGLAMAYAIGLRGLVGWGLAPALGLTVLGVSPIAAHLLAVPWSLGVWVTGAVAFVLLAAFVGMGLRLWWQAARRPRPPKAHLDSPATLGLGVLGVLLGTTLTLWAVLPGIGHPGELVDSTDVVAHLNRLRAFVDSGSFSSFGPPSAYPSGFHDLAGTAMLAVPGLGLTTAANLTAVVAACVIWPLGAVALARQALGRRPVVLLAAGLVSAGLTLFPYLLLGWGVLWPNLLGTALLPGVLGPALIATRTIDGPGTGASTAQRTTLGAATLLALPGLTLAHPNALVSLGMLVVVGSVTTLTVRAAAMTGRARRRAAVWALSLLLVSVAGLLAVPRLSRQVADTASYDWAGGVPLTQALQEVVLLGLQLRAQPVLVLVALVGLAVCARRRRLRWVVAVWAFCVLLFVLAATSRSPLGVLLTGYWYNDKVRLASLAAVPILLLVTAGVATLAHLLSRALTRVGPWAVGAGPAVRRRRAVATSTALLLLVAGTVGLAHADTTRIVDRYYHPLETAHTLLTPIEAAELTDLARQIPAGVVTADVPANGSGLLYALTGREVLYTSLLLDPDEDRQVVAEHLSEVTTRPDVCDAARRLNVQYAVTGTVRYWLSLDDRTLGISSITSATPGFSLVAESGRYRLWRIDACGFGSDATSTG